MTKQRTNKLIKRTTLAVMLTSAILSGCSEKSMESHLADARNYASSQQIDAAIVEYKNAIQKAPDAAAPRFELGKLYLQQSNFSAAEKELNKAMELVDAFLSLIKRYNSLCFFGQKTPPPLMVNP